MSLSTKVSVNDCEIDSVLWNVIAVAPALGVGDTCLWLSRSPEDLTKAIGEAVSEGEGALDMRQTLAKQVKCLRLEGKRPKISRIQESNIW